MAKEENTILDVTDETVEVPKKRNKKVEDTETVNSNNKPLINCLRNERVIVRHIPRQSRMVTNPKHILYGGMAENAFRRFVVPRLSSGRFVNVLTDDEKNFLENILGLEPNAMSIYKKVNNFWSDSNDLGISSVTLRKQDNYLNLAEPEDYIKYKILLANKDFIAPSLEVLENYPKATYQFVILDDESETKSAKKGMTTLMQCYAAYGKIEDDIDTMRVIIENMTNTKVHQNTKKDFLQTRVNDLIQSNGKMFLKLVTDPLLPTKVLIKRCVEQGLVSHRGDQYYIKEGGIPMCETGEPTLNVASTWLNLPKNQAVKLGLESKLS